MPDARPLIVPTERPASTGQKRKERRGTLLYGGLLAVIAALLLGPLMVLVWAGILFPGMAGPSSVPEPRRTVRPAAGVTAANMGRLLGQRLSQDIQSGGRPPYRARFTEAELSALLLSILPGTISHTFLRFTSGQIAVTPGELEASIVLDAPPFRFPLRVRAVPTGTSGTLHFPINDVRLGRLRVPPRLLPGLLGLFFQYDPRDISLRLGEHALVGVRATDRTLELLFE